MRQMIFAGRVDPKALLQQLQAERYRELDRQKEVASKVCELDVIVAKTLRTVEQMGEAALM